MWHFGLIHYVPNYHEMELRKSETKTFTTIVYFFIIDVGNLSSVIIFEKFRLGCFSLLRSTYKVLFLTK